jgi:hypothetical protein
MPKRNVFMAREGRTKKPSACTFKDIGPKETRYLTQAEKESLATDNFFHSRFFESFKENQEEMERIIKERI